MNEINSQEITLDSVQNHRSASQVITDTDSLVLLLLLTTRTLQSCPTLRPHRRQPTRLPRPWDSPGKNTGVGCHFLLQCMKVKSESEVAQLCLTLSNPMDCSLRGSSVHGIFQARVLEWGAIAFSRLLATTFYPGSEGLWPHQIAIGQLWGPGPLYVFLFRSGSLFLKIRK